MNEVLRGNKNETLDQDGHNLDMRAEYAISALKLATKNRTEAQAKAEQTFQEKGSAHPDAYEDQAAYLAADLKEDAQEMRATRHYQQNREGYEQAAIDENAARDAAKASAENTEVKQ